MRLFYYLQFYTNYEQDCSQKYLQLICTLYSLLIITIHMSIVELENIKNRIKTDDQK